MASYSFCSWKYTEDQSVNVIGAPIMVLTALLVFLLHINYKVDMYFLKCAQYKSYDHWCSSNSSSRCGFNISLILNHSHKFASPEAAKNTHLVPQKEKHRIIQFWTGMTEKVCAHIGKTAAETQPHSAMCQPFSAACRLWQECRDANLWLGIKYLQVFSTHTLYCILSLWWAVVNVKICLFLTFLGPIVKY